MPETSPVHLISGNGPHVLCSAQVKCFGDNLTPFLFCPTSNLSLNPDFLTSIVSHLLPISTAGRAAIIFCGLAEVSCLVFSSLLQSFLPTKACEVTLDLSLGYFHVQNPPRA